MGLNTSFDCWNGPCTSFMEWRQQLHAAITGEPSDTLEAAWDAGRYADQQVPINVLMNHSDCDGEIAHDQCLPLAIALANLAPKVSGYGFPSPRERLYEFTLGLLRAHAAGEPVRFH